MIAANLPRPHPSIRPEPAPAPPLACLLPCFVCRAPVKATFRWNFYAGHHWLTVVQLSQRCGCPIAFSDIERLFDAAAREGGA